MAFSTRLVRAAASKVTHVFSFLPAMALTTSSTTASETEFRCCWWPETPPPFLISSHSPLPARMESVLLPLSTLHCTRVRLPARTQGATTILGGTSDDEKYFS